MHFTRRGLTDTDCRRRVTGRRQRRSISNRQLLAGRADAVGVMHHRGELLPADIVHSLVVCLHVRLAICVSRLAFCDFRRR